jgi:hypothetical protein
MVVVVEMLMMLLKLTLLIESDWLIESEWFTTNTWFAVCWTACTGATPIHRGVVQSATLEIESPETSITMALPATVVPLSLIATTVWAAAGFGKVGGFGMIIGRKVSPQPVQIPKSVRTNPSQRNRFIQTP